MNSQDIREVVLRINDGNVTKKMETLAKTMEAAEKAKAKLEKKKIFTPKDAKDLQDYSKIIEDTKKKMDRMRASSEEVGRTLGNLHKATLPQLKKAIAAMEREMNSGKIERGSREWKIYQNALKETRRELNKLTREQKAAHSLIDRMKILGRGFVGITTVTMQALQALTGIRQTILGAVNAYAEMEEHMSQVRKYTGMTTEAVHELNEEFKKMDTRTARERLNDLAGDAGRLGIQGKKDILAFVQAADQINVALGEDLGEDGVKNIGKLAQLFGDSDRMGLKQAMLSTGSVINELAQSSSAAEGYILNFTSRLAGVGHQANMSQSQVMAFASILDQGMVRCERGATALQNVITALYRQPQKMAKVAGLDVKKFTETLQKDGNAALLQFIEALHKAGKMDVLAPMLKEMKLSGSGVTQTISTLANNLDKLKATQEQAAQAFKEGTSVTKEFNVQNNTVQGQMDKAKKKFHDVAVELGEKLQPAVRYLISGTSVGIKALNGLISFVANNIGTIVKLTLAVGALTVAWNWQRLATLAHTAALKISNGVMAIDKALTLSLTTAKAGLSLAYATLTRNTVMASNAMRVLNVVMKSNPIVKIVGLVISLGTAIYALISRTKKLTAAQKEQLALQKDLQSARDAANKAVGGEIARIKTLTAVIHDNAQSIDTRKKAIDALNRIVPGYHAEISKEGKITRENTKALKDHIEMLKKEAMAKALQDKITSLTGSLLTLEDSKGGRQLAVSRRRQRLSEYEQGHAEFIKGLEDKKHLTDPRGWGMAHKKELAEYRKLQDSLAEAEGWVSEVSETIDARNARINSLTQTFKRLGGNIDALLNFSSTGSITGGSLDDEEEPGVYNPEEDKKNSKEEQERRKAARDADVRIEQEAKEKLRKMDQEFVLSGRTDYLKYLEERNAAEVKYLEQRRDCWSKSDNEWVRYHEQIQEKQAGLQKEQNVWSLKDLDRQYAEKLALAKKDHILSAKTEEEKQEELDGIELEHLRKRAEWLRNNGGTPQEVIEAGVKADEKAKEQERNREVRQQERLKALKEEYLKKSAAEREKIEIELLNSMFDEEERKTNELYKRLLAMIQGKFKTEAKQERSNGIESALNMAGYNDEKWNKGKNYGASGIAGALVDVGNSINEINRAKETYAKLEELRKDNQISEQEYADAKEQLHQQSFDRFVGMAQAAYATVSEMLNSYTTLMNASRDAEIAKVEQRYDREIEAAGNSTAKGKKLEEQKQAEVAKIKNRYNKRTMVMEVAQAMAQTAMNALMAYGSVVKIPIVGPALAAAAAAAATAAGLIQVAAIKKQHEAESSGYYEGGFTGGKDYRRTAGVVHEGEFVANHKAVANPNIAPMLRLIDQAQRNNTIGSLTAEDVSRALPMSAASSVSSPMATQQPVVIQETERTSEALERLNKNIEDGIPSFVTIDGPYGLERQWRKYLQLMKRK